MTGTMKSSPVATHSKAAFPANKKLNSEHEQPQNNNNEVGIDSVLQEYLPMPITRMSSMSGSGYSTSSTVSSRRPAFHDDSPFYRHRNTNKKEKEKGSKYHVDWVPSESIKACQLCQCQFSVTQRKHHCRCCGHIICSSCSKNRLQVQYSEKKKRVCDSCTDVLKLKYEQDPVYMKPDTTPHNARMELESIQRRDASTSSKPAKSDDVWFIISAAWLKKWLDFVTNRSKKSPGPVSNFSLIDFHNGYLNPKENLSIQVNGSGDYRRVNMFVWSKFVELYGGGPAIWVTGLPIDDTSRWEIDLEAPSQEEFEQALVGRQWLHRGPRHIPNQEDSDHSPLQKGKEESIENTVQSNNHAQPQQNQSEEQPVEDSVEISNENSQVESPKKPVVVEPVEDSVESSNESSPEVESPKKPMVAQPALEKTSKEEHPLPIKEVVVNPATDPVKKKEEAASTIQKYILKRKTNNKHTAATMIQSRWKGYHARSTYHAALLDVPKGSSIAVEGDIWDENGNIRRKRILEDSPRKVKCASGEEAETNSDNDTEKAEGEEGSRPCSLSFLYLKDEDASCCFTFRLFGKKNKQI